VKRFFLSFTLNERISCRVKMSTKEEKAALRSWRITKYD